MDSKQYILDKIRRNTTEVVSKPEMNFAPIRYEDKVQKFIDMAKFAGGQAVALQPDEDLNELIRKYYPNAKRIASNLQGITLATYNPDDIATPGELNNTDLAIIKGKYGVAENGCVWVEQNVKHRALYFIAESLVLLVDRESIFHNMHEAYAHIEVGNTPFSGFISGPSKTADIEQALVVGAHGPRDTLVIVL